MMQKNIAKLQQKEIEKQRRKEGWLMEQEAKKQEEARLIRASKPMKIKVSSYTTDKSFVGKVVQVDAAQAQKLNVKF